MYRVYDCPKCEGTGYRIVKHGDKGKTNTIKSLYRFERVKCSNCNGTGLVKELVD